MATARAALDGVSVAHFDTSAAFSSVRLAEMLLAMRCDVRTVNTLVVDCCTAITEEAAGGRAGPRALLPRVRFVFAHRTAGGHVPVADRGGA